MRLGLSKRWPPILDNVARALNRVTTFVPLPPATNSAPEKVLVIQVHPYGNKPSFTLALGKALCESLEVSGHQVRVTNLYEENFEPRLGGPEHQTFLTAYRDGHVPEDIKTHIEDLQWCSGLCLVYPTWWYSFPAILKGWFDRTLIPGVAFDLPNGSTGKPNLRTGFISRLTNIKKVGMVTTFGNGFWNVRYVGDPGRRIVARGLRPNFHPRCTVLWKGLYDVEKCTPKKRESFLEDVKESFRGF